ncbi:MAG: arginase family protein, partial [Candidatus Saganbacteria bacterium]|nr:arginase family protein [Candidatus Saganbacteria bacterium]
MKKFFGLKNTPYPKAKYVILPVPYEATTTYGKGTKNGPAAIISASDQVELYDIELDIETYRIGINTAEWMKIKGKGEGVIKKIHSGVKRLLNDKKFPIVLGGEHSVSVGAVKAFREKYKNLSVLQFDAHSDL